MNRTSVSVDGAPGLREKDVERALTFIHWRMESEVVNPRIHEEAKIRRET